MKIIHHYSLSFIRVLSRAEGAPLVHGVPVRVGRSAPVVVAAAIEVHPHAETYVYSNFFF